MASKGNNNGGNNNETPQLYLKWVNLLTHMWLSPPYISVEPRPFMVHGEKLEKFSGSDFKRWQQKILFYLTTLNSVRFLREDPPMVNESNVDLVRHIAYN